MNPLTWMLFKRVWGIVAPVRSIPQVYLQEYCALLLLSMIQVRVTIAALSKHGGGRVIEEVHHPVQRLADARVLVADLQRGRQKPQISREAEQCACSPCQLFGSSLSQLCSNSTSRCLTGCSCYEVGQLRQRGGEAARRRWRGNGKRRQCVFARVLRQCAKDLANLCRL